MEIKVLVIGTGGRERGGVGRGESRGYGREKAVFPPKESGGRDCALIEFVV